MAVKSLGITTANSKKQNLEQRIKALQKQQELEDRKLNEKVAKKFNGTTSKNWCRYSF